MMRTTLMIFLLIFGLSATAEIKLPTLVSDNMILQRNTKLTIWGWASEGAPIEVSFHKKLYKAVADKEGKWSIAMDALKEGGPYEMAIKGDGSSITLKNILVGDVWVCSGQSNMAYNFTSARFKTFHATEIANSANENIRQILVNRTYSSIPEADFESTGWKSANANNTVNFSATAYYFAKNLYEKFHIPIGLINTSYGGTAIQPWMSADALKEFPRYADNLALLKDAAAINKKIKDNLEQIENWKTNTVTQDSGYKSGKAVWADVNLIDSEWKSYNMPALWDIYGFKENSGVFWHRKEINIPAESLNSDAVLKLGILDDEDETFFNGFKVGGTSGNNRNRSYLIPAKYILAGKNVITVRITNFYKSGGMVGDQPLELIIKNQHIPLNGPWKTKMGMTTDRMPLTYNPINLPASLYNAMIAPLVQYAVKGFIWYQGENNANSAKEYKALLPAMIQDWRLKWHDNELPFIFQQLPNYRAIEKQPSKSQWAELRDAQLTTSLTMLNVGMPVGIDIGEADNIHPINKADVGYRFSLIARKIAYGEKKLIATGPIYKSMSVENNNIIIGFEKGNGKLMVKDGPLKYFSIAGEDKKFYWAEAQIVGETVVVSSKLVKNPVAVRYAWADNPDGCNLFNTIGLPASPFRTDEW